MNRMSSHDSSDPFRIYDHRSAHRRSRCSHPSSAGFSPGNIRPCTFRGDPAVWNIGPRRTKVRYALAVYEGVVQEGVRNQLLAARVDDTVSDRGQFDNTSKCAAGGSSSVSVGGPDRGSGTPVFRKCRSSGNQIHSSCFLAALPLTYPTDVSLNGQQICPWRRPSGPPEASHLWPLTDWRTTLGATC